MADLEMNDPDSVKAGWIPSREAWVNNGENYFYLVSVSKKAWLMHAKLMIM